jgi:hypothetical protein
MDDNMLEVSRFQTWTVQVRVDGAGSGGEGQVEQNVSFVPDSEAEDRIRGTMTLSHSNKFFRPR